MLSRDEPGWSNPKVLTIFAVIFLCGVAFGSAGTRIYLHSKMPSPIPQHHAIEAAQRYGLQHLKQELDLTPEQEKIVKGELDDYAKYYQNIEDEREDVAKHGKQRILDILNDQQKRRFNQIFAQPPR